MKIDPSLLPLVGEYAWHSVTVDPRIAEMSREHYKLIRQVMESSFPGRSLADLNVLEVACYAHTTGYDLAQDLKCDVTLFELSAATLRLGRSLAGAAAVQPRLVIGDFHQLPFPDASFDFVFICSALHHTWNFEQVARELMRVVRPGGVLFIENEPVKRAACFYKFRCNREGDFTPLEKHLATEGWLRTFAEPYVGSRPETLFGMIENQQMPLVRLLDVFRESGLAEKIEVYPEICMGPRERAWFDARAEGVGSLTTRIEREIRAALLAARPLVGPVETGLGFTLPDETEVGAVAARTAERLCTLSGDPVGAEFRCGLADAFGAALRLTVRRTGAAPSAPTPVHVRSNAMESDGIFNGFPPQSQKILGQSSRLPSLQDDPPEKVTPAFPADQWNLSRNGQGIVSLSPRQTRAAITIAPNQEDSLLILRIYCGVGPDGFYELRLLRGADRLAVVPVYHAESRLCLAQIPPGTGEVVMEIGAINSNAVCSFKPPLAIAYAGLFTTSSSL